MQALASTWYRAGVVLLEPGEAFHQRGLSHAVDADEADPLPGGNTERDVAKLEALTVVRLAQAFTVDEARTSSDGSGDGGRSAGGGGRAAGVRVVARTQRRSSGHPAGSDVQRQQQRSKDEHWTAPATRRWRQGSKQADLLGTHHHHFISPYLQQLPEAD